MKKAEKAATSSRAKSAKTSAKSAANGKSAKAAAPAKAKAKAAPKAAAKSAKPPAKAAAKPKAAPKKAAATTTTKSKARVAKPKKTATPVTEAVELEQALEASAQSTLPLDDAAPPRELASESAAADAEPAPMSEEERELSSLYQDDLSAPSLAHGEFKDDKTADEDRPMMPEINARDERRRGWEDRRERRRQEREQRRLARRDGGGGHRPAEQRGNAPRPPQERRDGAPSGNGGGSGSAPPRVSNGAGASNGANGDRSAERSADRGAERPVAPAAAPVVAAPGVVAEAVPFGTPMGAATATLYAQLRNGQPLPVRQLASMLRKRGLIEGEPDLVWPQLRAELLADEQAYRSAGLRPRVVHRGRDLFAPGIAATSTVAELETQLVSSVAAIGAATARSLATWMNGASPTAFERMIYAYLVAVGYRDITWIKRVEGISYAQATAPGLERSVLISARAGDTPIDRRGIGELRVGVEAKGLPFGYLFSPAALSPDAERELERPGRSIAVVCGDALVTALIGAGLGVSSTAVAVRFLDDQFLEDLSVG